MTLLLVCVCVCVLYLHVWHLVFLGVYQKETSEQPHPVNGDWQRKRRKLWGSKSPRSDFTAPTDGRKIIGGVLFPDQLHTAGYCSVFKVLNIFVLYLGGSYSHRWCPLSGRMCLHSGRVRGCTACTGNHSVFLRIPGGSGSGTSPPRLHTCHHSDRERESERTR